MNTAEVDWRSELPTGVVALPTAAAEIVVEPPRDMQDATVSDLLAWRAARSERQLSHMAHAAVAAFPDTNSGRLMLAIPQQHQFQMLTYRDEDFERDLRWQERQAKINSFLDTCERIAKFIGARIEQFLA